MTENGCGTEENDPGGTSHSCPGHSMALPPVPFGDHGTSSSSTCPGGHPLSLPAAALGVELSELAQAL